MATKCTIESFPAEIQKILKKYGDDVDKNLASVIDEVAQKGATTLRSNSPVNPKGIKSGEYAKGWKVEKSVAKSGRGLNTSATIYNTHPSLPHLLEHGHALRQGGRSPATVHIAPVSDIIFEEVGQRLIKI